MLSYCLPVHCPFYRFRTELKEITSICKWNIDNSIQIDEGIMAHTCTVSKVGLGLGSGGLGVGCGGPGYRKLVFYRYTILPSIAHDMRYNSCCRQMKR